MNLRPMLLTALILASALLASCAGLQDDDDYGGQRRRGYYNNQPAYGQSGHDAYEERRRHEDANCNMGWSNCANVCNTIADANQRYVCVANCNVTLSNCQNRR
jgi:hypothetical protein